MATDSGSKGTSRQIDRGVPFVFDDGLIMAWSAATLAPKWFSDARASVPTESLERRWGEQYQAPIRRQIVFAVCFFESWFFEWVRDRVLDRRFEDLTEYFPDDDRRSVQCRVRDVVPLLRDAGLLTGEPDWNDPRWGRLGELLHDRHGLVHGGASRPKRLDQPGTADPRPEATRLARYDPEGPIRVAVAAVELISGGAGVPDTQWVDQLSERPPEGLD